jgi:hypothetical protein
MMKRKNNKDSKPAMTSPPEETPVASRVGRKGPKELREHCILDQDPQTPLTGTDLRRNQSRTARKEGPYFPQGSGQPRTARRRRAIRTFEMPGIPSPGNLRPIKENRDTDVDDIRKGVSKLNLAKDTKTPLETGDKPKAKCAHCQKATTRGRSKRTVEEEDDKDNKDPQATEEEVLVPNDETYEDNAGASDKDNNTADEDASLRQKKAHTPARSPTRAGSEVHGG